MKTNRHLLFLFQLLKSQHSRKSNQEQGYILVVALGIVLALSGLMALYAKTNNNTEKETTSSAVASNSGFYGAEAQLNIRANQIKEKFLNYGKPKGTSPSKADACLDNDSSNDGTIDYTCEVSSISSYNKALSDTLVTTYVIEKNGGVGVQGIVPQGDNYQGLSMLEVGHSIYALSFKETDVNNKNDGKQATAILQMDVKSRLIPMFQFAAFYVGDLEIFPGAAMTLSGPIHTNGDLFMGSNVSLDVKGQVTTVKDIYARRKHKPSETFDGARISTQLPDTTGSFLKNLIKFASDTAAKTQLAMNPQKIATNWGNQIKVRTEAPVSIPEPSFLNTEGDYYKKADIRITFKPIATSTANYLNTVPFEITGMNRQDPDNPIETKLLSTGETFNTSIYNAKLKSLRQPIMVGADLAAIPAGNYNVCPSIDTALPTTKPANNTTVQNWWNALTTAQKNTLATNAQNYLQEQILSQSAPLSFNSLSNTATKTLLTAFASTTPPTGFNDTEWKNIKEMNPQEIAGLTSRCFVAAPILEVGRDVASHTTPFRYYNVREGRDMRLLQINIQSLVIWNRDGQYLNGTTLTSTADLLYTPAAADANAPANSFQRLGLAALDDTEGGMVVHATINDSATTRKASLLTSPYGFAFINGKQLFGLGQTTTHPDPTGVTIASDQAIYVQGDYNNVNKQPASILADSFNPLSNACLNDDRAINHLNEKNCNINGSNVLPTDTTFNAGVLSGTDVSVVNGAYNGGLENYPRFAENWGGRTWTYRGSFVSIAEPKYVSGVWGKANVYDAPNRNWDYDTDFNDPNKLPPLTPQFVVLKQESFIRSFDQ
ncbi:hypothetical protein [Geminocystis sp.]|uniref:hypothetical protein n=1 Tax=Geminocystis sp. TaxID=2664100 RepID=UPI003593167B